MNLEHDLDFSTFIPKNERSTSTTKSIGACHVNRITLYKGAFELRLFSGRCITNIMVTVCKVAITEPVDWLDDCLTSPESAREPLRRRCCVSETASAEQERIVRQIGRLEKSCLVAPDSRSRLQPRQGYAHMSLDVPVFTYKPLT